MSLITLSVIKINEEPQGTLSGSTYTPVSFQIEDSRIKYVYQSGIFTTVIYYDELSAKLVYLLVTETPEAIYDLYAGFLIITAESIDDITSQVRPMLLNELSVCYGVALSSKDPNSLAIIAYGSLTGTFNVNDVVQGDTSLATAKIITDDATGLMVVHPLKGVLQAADVLTVISSPTNAATATITTYTAANQKYYQYEPGIGVARKKKDIIAYLSANNLNYAITAVSLANNTFTISGNHQARLTRDVPFFVDGSTANDGLYSVLASIVTGGNTVITVAQVIPSATADGTIIDS